MAQQQIGKQSASLAVRAREFIPVPQVFRKRKCPMLVVCRKLPMPGTGPRQSAFSTIRRSLSFTRSKPEYPFMPRASHSALSAWTEAFSSSPCFQNAAAPMGSPSIITEAMDHASLLPSTCLQHSHAHAKTAKAEDAPQDPQPSSSGQTGKRKKPLWEAPGSIPTPMAVLPAPEACRRTKSRRRTTLPPDWE